MIRVEAGVRAAVLGAIALFLGCGTASEGATSERVGDVEFAIRNGVKVTPFGPDPAPAWTKNIVSFGGCTGTIVAPNWVLSAQHCNYSAGVQAVSKRPTGDVTRDVDQVVNHPNVGEHKDVDTVMLHLSSPFDDVGAPPPLFYGNAADIDGKSVISYGYGWEAAVTSGCTTNAACGAGKGCDVPSGVCYTPTTALRSGVMSAATNTFGSFYLIADASGQMPLFGDSGGPVTLDGKLVGVNGWWQYDLTRGGSSTLPVSREWMLELINDGEDIVWHNGTTGATQFWRMNGINRLAFTDVDSSLNTADASGWLPVARADFNKDGKVDILWQNLTSGATQIWFLENNGTRFMKASLNTVSSGWRLRGSADYNRDGSSDLLLQNVTSGALQVWYMNGYSRQSVANLDAGLNTPDSTGWKVSGTGDFNQDGSIDLFWHNGTTGDSQVWYMDGIARTSAANFPASLNVTDSSGWYPVSVIDKNHDGKPDILWHNANTGALQVWYMNGTSRSSYAELSSSLNVPQSTGWRIVAH